jgi:beta-lactamase regulating signal transducer with metallopeptidase domain
MTGLWLANVVAYSLQVAGLVATTLVVSRALPIRDARWRLRLWQAVFAVAVLLPLSQLLAPGAPDAPSALVVFARDATASRTGAQAFWLDAAAVVLIAGALVRLAQLVLGWLAIRRYVRRATPLEALPDLPSASAVAESHTDVRLSGDVRSPATVGGWRAVILVPPAFLALSEAARRAVLLHEALHVERRDWVWTAMRPVA